jgi:hypothetical protein
MNQTDHSQNTNNQKKMLNIFSHKRNENQNYIEIYLNPVRVVIIKETTNVGEDVGGKRPLIHPLSVGM